MVQRFLEQRHCLHQCYLTPFSTSLAILGVNLTKVNFTQGFVQAVWTVRQSPPYKYYELFLYTPNICIAIPLSYAKSLH